MRVTRCLQNTQLNAAQASVQMPQITANRNHIFYELSLHYFPPLPEAVVWAGRPERWSSPAAHTAPRTDVLGLLLCVRCVVCCVGYVVIRPPLHRGGRPAARLRTSQTPLWLRLVSATWNLFGLVLLMFASERACLDRTAPTRSNVPLRPLSISGGCQHGI